MVAGIGLLCVLFLAIGLWLHGQVRAMFPHAVAIVDMEERGTVRATASAKPQGTPIAAPVSPTNNVHAKQVLLPNDSTSAALVRAIERREPQSETVTNVLLLLDGDVYIVSKTDEQLQYFAVNTATLVPVENNGWTTLGQSYQMGGIACLINTINQFWDLDIQTYVFVNSTALWSASDHMGGWSVTLSANEANAMNQALHTAYAPEETILWTGGLEAYSKLHTDGTALDHWRKAVGGIAAEAKETHRQQYLWKAITNSISTNATLQELYQLQQLFFEEPSGKVSWLPQEGAWMLVDGIQVQDADAAKEQRRLKELMHR